LKGTLAFDFANGALKNAAKAGLPIENWRSAALADGMARKASGLDDSERNQTINIGMQMVEFRLANISLPPDAPHASSPDPPR
jgi:hypothetical protein